MLKIAREHDFIILEGKKSFLDALSPELTILDDPYYYLYYGKCPRSPSYFTLELQEPQVGRVLRFDSMSKILSAGIRIGFASGPEAILAAMDRHVRLLDASQENVF